MANNEYILAKFRQWKKKENVISHHLYARQYYVFAAYYVLSDSK